MAMGLLCAAIVIASFLKTDWPRNDFERFEDLRLTVSYFILLTAACLGYAKLCFDEVPLSRGAVVGGALAAGGLLWVSFPVGSKDVFLYALFGKVWGTYHVNPYQVAPIRFIDDPWLEYVQTLGAQRPAPYGPLFLWQAWVGDAVARGHLWVAAWVHKTIATLALAVALLIAARLSSASGNRDRWQVIALLVWNPLLLFESAGNGHNDAIMLLLLVAAAYVHIRGNRSGTVLKLRPDQSRTPSTEHRTPTSTPGQRAVRSVFGALPSVFHETWVQALLVPAMVALAIWYKWYAVLVMPAFLIAVYRERGWADSCRWLLSAFGLVGLFGVILMAPFVDAAPLVLQRLIGHENLRTVFPMQLSPPLAVLFWVCGATGLGGGTGGLLWFDMMRVALFGCVVGAVLLCQWRGSLTLVQAVCLLTLDLAMFGFTILWPWHLMVPVGFALLAGTQLWTLLALSLTLLGLLSYFFTFIWAATVLIIVAGVLVLMRQMQRFPSLARSG